MNQLQPLGDDLWVLDGPTAIDLLVVPYSTRMTIARLGDGGLWIASPIVAPLDQVNEIASLGPVRHLLSPTPRHQWRLEAWHRLFPDAKLWASRQSPFTLGGRDLPLEILGDEPPAAWADDLDQASLKGIGFNEVVFLHRSSRTLLVEDVFQSHDHRPGKPLVNALIKVGGLRAPGGVARDIRATLRDKDGARAWARKVLGWDFDRIVMAHGPIVTDDAKGYVERALSWLLA